MSIKQCNPSKIAALTGLVRVFLEDASASKASSV